MKQSTAALVLLALVCGQAVHAGPIGTILTAPLAVAGGVAKAAGDAAMKGAQAAVNTAAAVKKTVDDTVTDKVRRWPFPMHIPARSQTARAVSALHAHLNSPPHRIEPGTDALAWLCVCPAG